MGQQDLKEFKKDLRSVLRKHKATIGVDLEGDTHGLRTHFIATAYGKTFSLNRHSAYLDEYDIKL